MTSKLLSGFRNDLLKQNCMVESRFSSGPTNKGGARPIHILIYAHFSEERDGVALLETPAKSLNDSGIQPQYIIFTTYQERENGTARIGTVRADV